MIPIFLSAGDLQLLDDVSATTAYRRIAEIKKHFGIKKYQKISLINYADFHHFSIDFVISMIEKKQQRKG